MPGEGPHDLREQSGSDPSGGASERTDEEVSYSARDCRCGAAMRRTSSEHSPYRWYCGRCGRHIRR